MVSLFNQIRTWKRLAPAAALLAMTACGLRIGPLTLIPEAPSPKKSSEPGKSTGKPKGDSGKPNKPGPQCVPPAPSDEYKKDVPELASMASDVEKLKAKSAIELWKIAAKYAHSEKGLDLNADDSKAFADKIVKSGGAAALVVHVRAWGAAYREDGEERTRYKERRALADLAASRGDGLEFLATYIRAFQFAYLEKEGLGYELEEAREFAGRVAALPYNVPAIAVFMRTFLFSTRDPDGLQIPVARAIDDAMAKACIPLSRK